jgi:hypothetical protein
MSIEIINRKAAEDRRSVSLNPASMPVIKAGQVLRLSGGFAILADGAAFVADPMWAFTSTGRLDVDQGKSVTVVEAPFQAFVNTDCYAGSPVAGAALKIGTGADVGKLVTATLPADMSAGLVVATCVAAPDADGKLRIKAIR